MDINSYPDEEELQKIREWNCEDFSGLMEYVEKRWRYAELGYWRKTRTRYYISTGGWSGNEEIVQAMQENVVLWMFYWKQSTRGGHYILEDQKFNKPVHKITK